MAPPPSDQELIASFTPRQYEYYTWHEATRDIRKKLRRECDWTTLTEMLHQRWPDDPDIKENFEAWQLTWADRHFQRHRYQMTPAEFFDMISSTNFLERGSFASFCWKMETFKLPLLVLLGESRFGGVFTGYALLPGTQALWPHLDVQPEDPSLLYSGIMGINLNVIVDQEPEPDYSATSERRRRRQQDRSSGEDSVRTTDSGDIEGYGGFTFVQIGALYTFGAGWEEKRTKDVEQIMHGPWLTTGFAVVIELDARGRLGAVWAIYSFHAPEDDEEAPPTPPKEESYYPEREYHGFDEDLYAPRPEAKYGPAVVPHIPLKDSSGNPLSHIGRPTEGCNETFTVAKIANSFGELQQGHTRQFDFDVQSQKECQLVRAKIYDAGQGRWLLRQFVKSQP